MKENNVTKVSSAHETSLVVAGVTCVMGLLFGNAAHDCAAYLGFESGRRRPGNVMQILQMTAQIPTLCELLVADLALKGPCRCVLAEMVSQIAALPEHGAAVHVFAAEVIFAPFRHLVVHLDGFMPLGRDPFKRLVVARVAQ